MPESADLIVLGGGIVGLATAREYLIRHPGASVVVLEKADEVATGQTGHNSGVIHAGLYYQPGSLKARLCRAGEQATKEFCDEQGIEYRTIGKLVVATTPLEAERMQALAGRAAANGIELSTISQGELAEMEPNITGVGALVSPRTGVVDFREVARAMAKDVVGRGGRVIARSEVRTITETPDGVRVSSDSGEYRADRLIACAGLQADRVARLGGLEVDFAIVPFRGEYYQLPNTRTDIVTRLIYPVPDPDLPFLGVHLSPTVDGRITVGPNAVLGFARERYPRGSVNSRDAAAMARFPGLWRFAKNNLRTGIDEMRNSLSRKGYLELVRKYCPSLTVDDLLPYPAGIRAQAIKRDGSSVDDFLIQRSARQTHVCNAPSPAATSAIPIARHLLDQL